MSHSWPREVYSPSSCRGNVSVRAMRSIAQHFKKFGGPLRWSAPRPIVERSRKDRFWGAVLEADGVLRGQNRLGRLLMELREELLTCKLVSLLTKSAMNLEHALRTIGATSDSSMSTQRGGRTDGCIPATKPERES